MNNLLGSHKRFDAFNVKNDLGQSFPSLKKRTEVSNMRYNVGIRAKMRPRAHKHKAGEEES